MKPKNSLLIFTATAAALGFPCPFASAANETWDGSTNGNWDDVTNWVSNTGFPGTGNTALFNSTVANNTISLNRGDRSINSITIGTGAPSNFTFNNQTFLMDSGGAITMQSTVSNTPTITFNSALSLGGNYTFTNSRASAAAALIFNGNITNTATSTLSITGGGTGTGNKIAGIISNGSGGTVQSVDVTTTAGTWELSNANTFSGALTKSGAGNLILSGSNNTAGTTSLAGGITTFGSGANSGLASGLLTLGAGTYRSSNTADRTFSNGLSLSGALKFSDATNTGAMIFKGNGVLTADTVFDVLGTSSGAVALEGNLSGSGFNLRKAASASSLFLLGDNTYTGTTTVTNGVIVFDSVENVGNATANSLGVVANATTGTIASGITGSDAAILRYIGAGSTTDRVLQTGSASAVTGSGTSLALDASGSGALNWTSNMSNLSFTGEVNTRTFRLAGTNRDNNTYSGVISNNAITATVFSKRGRGTWVLSGANSFTGGINLAGGKTILDYASNATVVNAGNALTMGDIGSTGGAELVIKGKTGAFTTTQTLGNLTLGTETANTITLDSNGGTGTNLTLGNTWTNGFQVGLLIDLSSPNTTLTSAPTLTNSILGYAVVKDATTTGFATVTGGSVVRLTTFSGGALPTGTLVNTSNYLLTGNLNRATTSTAYSLSVDTTGGGTLDLGAGLTTTLNSGYILFSGNGDYLVSNGTLSAGSNATVNFQQYSTGTVTVTAGIGNGTGSLNKFGPGTLVISDKIGTGKVRVLGGVLRANGANVLDSEIVVLGGGGVLELTSASGNMTKTVGIAAGNISFVGGDGGFSAFGGDRLVQLNGGTASIGWGSSNFVSGNNALVLSSAVSDSTIDFQNGLGFGNGQRVVSVNNGSAPVDAKLSGILSGGYGGGLVKRGAGTLSLTNSGNTYAGDTWVNAGTLSVDNTSGSGTGTGSVSVFSGATLGGTGIVSGTTGVTGGTVNGTGITLTGLTTFNSSGNILSGTVTSTNGVTLASGAALQINGALTGTLSIGNGTLTGTSGSVSGAATLNGGTVNLTSGTLGSTLAVTGGNWNGAGSVTGLVTSSSGTFSIGSSGNLTANGDLAITGGTLAAAGTSSTITGSVNYTSSSDSSFQGIIAGSGRTLTLNGASTLALSGFNTYTGATAVTSGKMIVTGAIASSSGVSVANGATLAGETSDAGVTNGKVSAITLNGGSGTGGVLAPGNGTAGDLGSLYASSLIWNGATDSVFSQMKFDLSNSDATSDQLVLSGAMSKGTGSIFDWDFGNTGAFDTTYTLVTAVSGFGTFNALTDFSYSNLASGVTGSFSISGSNLQFTTFSAVPEPTSALAGLLISAGLLRRRRR